MDVLFVLAPFAPAVPLVPVVPVELSSVLDVSFFSQTAVNLCSPSTLYLSPGMYLEKVKKIKNGETVEVTVKATHPKFNVSDSNKVSVTLNLPDVIPGSQEKPAGYVTVTFAKGEHGSLSGELSQHVNPMSALTFGASVFRSVILVGFTC